MVENYLVFFVFNSKKKHSHNLWNKSNITLSYFTNYENYTILLSIILNKSKKRNRLSISSTIINLLNKSNMKSTIINMIYINIIHYYPLSLINLT